LRKLSADQHHCTDREVKNEAGDKQDTGDIHIGVGTITASL